MEILLRSRGAPLERALDDDAREMPPVLGRRETVAEDLGARAIASAVIAVERANGVAPMPVSATL